MADPSFYFLLKTENIQPLIDTVDEFSHQIELNQATINSISTQIDLENTSSNPEKDNSEEKDMIRYLLLQKYKIEDVSIESSQHLYHKNPKINQLIHDNIRLAKLRREGAYKNQELLKIIYDYESLIIEQILPALRNDLSFYKNPNYVDLKFTAVNEIYSRYNINIQYLTKIIKLFSGLFKFLNQYDSLFYQLLNQFEVLTQIHNRLLNMNIPITKKVKSSTEKEKEDQILPN